METKISDELNIDRKIPLYPGERLEDLGNGLAIIQNPEYFCFGIDAVLLSWFAAPALKYKSRTAEIGTGTGIIPLLLCAKSKVANITAFEIQPHRAQMAARSVALNRLQDRIEVVCEDIRTQQRIGASTLDVIVSNPPYVKTGTGLKNPKESLAVSRHEISLTAEDLLRFASTALKDKGRLFIVHKPERLTELCQTGGKLGLELKRIQMVHPRIDRQANLVLAEFVKGGKPYLITEPPLIVYDGERYTDQIHTIYGTEGPSRTVLEECVSEKSGQES